MQRRVEEEEAVQAKGLPSYFAPVPSDFHDSTASSGLHIHRLCTECEEEQRRKLGKQNEMAQRKPERYQLHDNYDKRERRVQPKGVSAPTPQVTPSVAANIHALNHGGSPLPQATQAFFEPRFGTDFSQVRVQTGSRAAETARSINARAFTVGRNIAFGPGQFAPESPAGSRLLAHELTHVVQQTGGSAPIAQSKGPDHSGAVHRNPEVSVTGSLIVQRDGPLGKPKPTPGPASGTGAVVTPPPRDELHAIVHEQRQLSEDWKQTQALLKRMIAEEGWEATDAWAYRFINAEPIRDMAYGDVALVARIRDRLRIEIKMMENSVKQLVGDVKLDLGDVVIGGGDFPSAAHQHTQVLLNCLAAREDGSFASSPRPPLGGRALRRCLTTSGSGRFAA